MRLRAASGSSEGLWLRAEKQTGGKGRLGRVWESPAGNLYCSGLVDIGQGDPEPSSLSFVAALAVFDTIRYYLPASDLMLKWPNDLLLSDAKVCGILLERFENKIIVGIGVNITVAPQVEGRSVTCLHDAGADISLNPEMFLEKLAQSFSSRLDSWRKDGLVYILQQWEKRAHPINAALTVTAEQNKKMTGAFAGLSAIGALRLRKPDGTLIEIHAGDVEAG